MTFEYTFGYIWYMLRLYKDNALAMCLPCLLVQCILDHTWSYLSQPHIGYHLWILCCRHWLQFCYSCLLFAMHFRDTKIDQICRGMGAARRCTSLYIRLLCSKLRRWKVSQSWYPSFLFDPLLQPMLATYPRMPLQKKCVLSCMNVLHIFKCEWK